MIKRMDKEILAKYHQGRRIVRKYHQGRLYYQCPWVLTAATTQAIMAAFGVDGPAVIAATNEYLNGIAASDKAKATALAGFINEDPMMVCSLGLEPQGVTMPVRWLVGDGSAMVDTGVKATDVYELEIKFKVDNPRNTWNAIFGASLPWSNTSAINLAAWAHKQSASNINFHTRIGANAGTDWNVQVGTTEHTVLVNLQGIYFDGVKIGTPSRMWDIPTTVGMFMYINSDTPSAGSETLVGRIAWCEMRDQNKKAISRVIPADCTQGIGMVDAVRGIFLPKIGSGSFTIPDISYTPTP